MDLAGFKGERNLIMLFIYIYLGAMATLLVLGGLYELLGDAGVIAYYAGFTVLLIAIGVALAGRQ